MAIKERIPTTDNKESAIDIPNELFHRKRKLKIFNFRVIPFLAIIAAASIITAALPVAIGWKILILALLALVSCLVVWYVGYPKALMVIACLVAVLVFGLFFARYYGYQKSQIDYGFHYVSAKIDKENGKTDENATYIVTDIEIDGTAVPYKGELALPHELITQDDVGRQIAVYATVTEYTFDGERIISEDYALSRYSKGIKYYFAYRHGLEKGEVKRNPRQHIRVYAKNTLYRFMGERIGATVFSTIFGTDTDFNQEDLDAFRSLNVAHIFAVSGLHIGVFVGLMSKLLRKSKLKPHIRTILVLSATFFFVYTTGFTSSGMRAFVMSACFLMAGTLGYRNDGISSLCFAFLVLTIIDPLSMFSLGFALSFAAVGGLLLLHRPISKTLRILPKWLNDGLSASISANLGLFPLTALYFENISPLFLLSNLIVVPLMSFVFVATMAMLLVAWIPYIGYILKIPYIIALGVSEFSLLLATSPLATFGLSLKQFYIVPWCATILIGSRFNILDKTYRITATFILALFTMILIIV